MRLQCNIALAVCFQANAGTKYRLMSEIGDALALDRFRESVQLARTLNHQIVDPMHQQNRTSCLT